MTFEAYELTQTGTSFEPAHIETMAHFVRGFHGHGCEHVSWKLHL